MGEIDQQRMQYFYEVLIQGSIRDATESLNVSPSVVNRQIRLLKKSYRRGCLIVTQEVWSE